MSFAGIFSFQYDSPLQADRLKKAFQQAYGDKTRVYSRKNLFFIYEDKEQYRCYVGKDFLFFGHAYQKSNFLVADRFEIERQVSGSGLYDNIWGHFINIFLSGVNVKISIDSTGATELFYTRLPNGDMLFATDLSLMLIVANQSQALNHNYLLNWLIQDAQNGTVFIGIHKIATGCELVFDASRHRITIGWNPRNFINTNRYLEIDFAELLTNVLRTWCKPYQNVFLGLSGGLDSNAILNCLLEDGVLNKDTDLVAINYYNKTHKASNEVEHAKKSCARKRVKLQVHDLDSFSYFEKIKKLDYKLNKPHYNLIFWNHQEDLYRLSGIDANSLYIKGYGGDHVFMQRPAIDSVVDAFLKEDLFKALRSIKQLCAINRENIFHIFKENAKSLFRRMVSGSAIQTYAAIPTWLNVDASAIDKNILWHPALHGLKEMPGKARQVNDIYLSLSSLAPRFSFDKEAPFNVFLTQPVIEWALSVPSYELYGEEIDRYPVRKSIRSKFGSDSIWRQEKSTNAGSLLEGINKNFKHVHETFLNGFYVRNGYVNPESLALDLSLIASGDLENLWSVCQLYCGEIFLSQWNDFTQGKSY